MKHLVIVSMILIFSFTLVNSSYAAIKEESYIDSLNSSQVFIGNDIIFNFNLSSGVLKTVNGCNGCIVLNNDIEIRDNTIIISHEYFFRILEEDSNRRMTVFSWVFEAHDGSNIIVGYLFVNLQKGMTECSHIVSSPFIILNEVRKVNVYNIIPTRQLKRGGL